MNTILDLRLAYKADTGYLPIKRDDSSLRNIKFDFYLKNQARADNEEAFEIEAEAQQVLENAKSWAVDLLDYINWLEEKILKSKNKIRRSK